MKIKFIGPITQDHVDLARFDIGSIKFEKEGRQSLGDKFARFHNDDGRHVCKGCRKLRVDVSTMGCDVSKLGRLYLEELGYVVNQQSIILFAHQGTEIDSLNKLCYTLEEEGIFDETEVD